MKRLLLTVLIGAPLGAAPAVAQAAPPEDGSEAEAGAEDGDPGAEEGPAAEGEEGEESAEGEEPSDDESGDPVGPPPAVFVEPVLKTRHNLYTGFHVKGGITTYDTLHLDRPVAGGFGFGFRMGGRVNEAFGIGGQVYADFSLRGRAGAVGAMLLEFSVFPLKKLHNRGLALHFGLGGISWTHAIPDPDECDELEDALSCAVPGETLTNGGLTTLISAGWDFWLQNRFNFGIHARVDTSLIPSFEPRPIIVSPGIELALNWY